MIDNKDRAVELHEALYKTAMEIRQLLVSVRTRKLDETALIDSLDQMRVSLAHRLRPDKPIISLQPDLAPMDIDVVIDMEADSVEALRAADPHAAAGVATVLERIVDKLRSREISEGDLRYLLLLLAGLLRGVLIV